METQTTSQQIFIKMALSAWDTQNNNLNRLINSLTDEQLSKEIAPGKNTGIYLLGHLIAVSDGMLPLLGFSERLYPRLESIFIKNPDKSGLEQPSIAVLKDHLKNVNEKLSEYIRSATADGWFERHAAVSAEDFAKEPHRNKLNIIINRTGHMSYHLGQMVLLK